MANFWVFQTFLINIFCILTNKKTTANFLIIDQKRMKALEGDCTSVAPKPRLGSDFGPKSSARLMSFSKKLAFQKFDITSFFAKIMSKLH